MELIRSPIIHHLRDLNRCLDQAANMSMKIPVLGFTFGILMATLIGGVQARDDGRYSLSPLKPWFDGLWSGKGPCCSDADGFALSDPDWESKSGHYRVRVDNEWIDVPDDAVITEPNRAGRTMVWPIKGSLGTSIRCFMPASITGPAPPRSPPNYMEPSRPADILTSVNAARVFSRYRFLNA